MSLGKYVHKFESLGELVSVAIDGKSDMPTADRSSRDTGRDTWQGTSWENAAAMARNGDIEGAKRLAPAMLTAVNSMVNSMPRLDPVYRLDEGRWIDVARYVKGEPECWGDMVEAEPLRRKGAAVVINVAANAGVKASAIDAVGIQVGSAILGMQALGYSVTLYAVEKISGGAWGTADGNCYICAPVNPGGCPLDVSRLSVILRPWFLRRIIFSVNETWDEKTRQGFGIGNGYGSAQRLKSTEAEELTGHKNAIIVDVGSAAQYPGNVASDIIRQIKGD